MLPRRSPSLGALVLLALLIVVLLNGGEDGERERGSENAGRQERPAGDRADDRGRDRQGERSAEGRGEGGSRDGEGGSAADPQGGGGGGEGGAGTPGTTVPVTRAVDGDTIEVLIGASEEDVRYIGVDTPESVAPGEPVECFGPQASDFNADLVEGHQVRLVFDAERRDTYGRLLAYVYLGDTFVNAELVRRGFARTLTIPPNDSFAGVFARLEQNAAAAGRGLWGRC